MMCLDTDFFEFILLGFIYLLKSVVGLCLKCVYNCLLKHFYDGCFQTFVRSNIYVIFVGIYSLFSLKLRFLCFLV